MSQYNDILEQYRLSQSIKGVAAVLNISEQTVRRTLITAGLYTSERAKRIQQLYVAGMPTKDIAELLKISTSTVSSYIPYRKGPRKDWGTTVNAMRIKKMPREKETRSNLKS